MAANINLISNLFTWLLLILVAILSAWSHTATAAHNFSIIEATVDDLQLAFKQNKLTCRQLVEFYIKRIRRLNPVLHGVIEANPDALDLADKADRERKVRAPISFSRLHGIPVLLKDNIATRDKTNTTAGSYALLGSVVPRDAGVVAKLKKAGAIILGKASMTEWAAFRGNAPNGWSARGGQGVNPYNPDVSPCGSSSGSAISAAANFATVTLGTETDGSILCPSSLNSVVGIKPTIGLTSRAGVVPISLRQDTVGSNSPICRTVSDAAYVLDAIAGVDKNDIATIEMSKYIPKGGYAQFLRHDGLKGKRIGIVRHPFFEFNLSKEIDSALTKTFEQHLNTIRKQGAVLINHLQITNIDEILDGTSEYTAMVAEFKIALNAYLKELVTSPVRSLADVIAFNNKNSELENIKEYGQELMLIAEATNGIGKAEKAALAKLSRQTREGFVKLMTKYKLDALVASGGSAFPFVDIRRILAIGGFPGITVPAGYIQKVPYGIFFCGLKGYEPKLIEIAYGFEQATKIRKPPSLKSLKLRSKIHM